MEQVEVNSFKRELTKKGDNPKPKFQPFSILKVTNISACSSFHASTTSTILIPVYESSDE